jgi:Predicted CoA-binding protein
MQEGISNDEARKLAESRGITVIFNRCMMKEHKRLFGD